MPYGDLNYVKGRLHIPNSNISQDDELNRMLQEADDFIDSILQMFIPTPLAQPPDQVRRLSNKLAVEWYYHYNTPLHPMDGVNSAKKEIEQYIRAVYGHLSETIGQNRITKVASGILGTEGT
jgi:hypothetical protein